MIEVIETKFKQVQEFQDKLMENRFEKCDYR